MGYRVYGRKNTGFCRSSLNFFLLFIFHRMWMKKSSMTGTNKCSRVSTKPARKKVTKFDPEN